MKLQNLRTYLSIAVASVAFSDVEAYRPGATVCAGGFVMDAHAMQQDDTLLEAPELYLVSSLVDEEESLNSDFYILEEPEDGETRHSEGWKVTDKSVLVAMARDIGVCATCEGEGTLKAGFRVEVTGMIMNLYPPTLEIQEARGLDLGDPICGEPTPNPTAAPTTASPTVAPTPGPTVTNYTYPPTSASPSAAPTNAPTEAPTSAEPTQNPTNPPTLAPSSAPSPSPTTNPSAAPTEAPTKSPSYMPSFAPTVTPPLNCSEYQERFEVSNMNVTIDYVVRVDDYDSTKSTLSARVVYPGQAWLGFGVSPDGGMNGSSVVIGSVQTTTDTVTVNPGKYLLGGNAQSFINLAENQSLMKQSIMQNETHTVLTFTRYLEEEGEVSINGTGVNTFIVAYGFSNQFAYHRRSTSFELELSPCINEVEELYNITHIINVTSNATGNVTLPDDGDVLTIEAPSDVAGIDIPFDEAITTEIKTGSGSTQGSTAEFSVSLVRGRSSSSTNSANNDAPVDAFASSQANVDGTLEGASGASTMFMTSSALVAMAACLCMV